MRKGNAALPRCPFAFREWGDFVLPQKNKLFDDNLRPTAFADFEDVFTGGKFGLNIGVGFGAVAFDAAALNESARFAGGGGQFGFDQHANEVEGAVLSRERHGVEILGNALGRELGFPGVLSFLHVVGRVEPPGDFGGQGVLRLHRMHVGFSMCDFFGRALAEQIVVTPHEFVADGHEFAVDDVARFADSDVIAEGFGHFGADDFAVFDAGIGPLEQGQGEDDLGFLAVFFLELTPDEEIEELVGTAEFDVSVDGDRIVALEQGVEEFVYADGASGRVTFFEIVAFEHTGDGIFGGKRNEIGRVHLAEPSAVKDDFGLVAVENFEDLFGVGLCVGGDLFGAQGFSGLAFTRRIADTAGKVADEEDDLVSEVLELAKFAKHDEVPEMKVWGRGIGAKFDAKGFVFGTTFFEFFDEFFGNVIIDDTPKEDFKLFFGGQKRHR